MSHSNWRVLCLQAVFVHLVQQPGNGSGYVQLGSSGTSSIPFLIVRWSSNLNRIWHRELSHRERIMCCLQAVECIASSRYDPAE